MKLKLESRQPQNMELKYCERCGNLWLRRIGSPRTLCEPCVTAETCPGSQDSFLRRWTRLRAEVQA